MRCRGSWRQCATSETVTRTVTLKAGETKEMVRMMGEGYVSALSCDASDWDVAELQVNS